MVLNDMPTQLTKNYGTYLDQYCTIEQGKTFEIGHDLIVTNSPDSRPRPAGRLVLSPTKGDRQYIQSHDWLVYLIKYKPSGCTSGVQKKIYYHESTILENGEFTFPATNVVTKWRNKVKGLRLDLSSYVAEVRETADLATNIVRNVVGAVKYVRKRKYKRAFNQLVKGGRSGPFNWGDVSAAWLLSNFAYGPMFNDLADHLAAIPAAELRDLLIRIVATDERMMSTSYENTSSSVHTALSERVKTRDVAIGYVRLLPSWRTFTGGNPLQSIWEGVPLSFVVDYFTNVGDYLANIDALDGVEVAAGTITRRTQGERSFYVSGFDKEDDYINSVTNEQSGRYTERGTERVVTNFPLDPPDLTFHNGASIKRLLNMVAIADQQRRSRL